MSVTRCLHDVGLKSHEKQVKPKLSQANIKNRLDFANKCKDWTVEGWKKVIWSDETKINRFCSDGRSWYWAHEGTSLQPHHVKQTIKHGGGSIMIWGCMTTQGPGFMCKIDGKMDQHLYKTILEGELAKKIDFYGLNPREVIFQHDNCPIHKAKTAAEYLQNREYQVLEQPAQSPDLNPVENLWSKVKRELNKYESPPNGMIEFWARIQETWGQKITVNDCMVLIESISRSIEAVRKAKGWWAKY